jgi:hypothetical protein
MKTYHRLTSVQPYASRLEDISARPRRTATPCTWSLSAMDRTVPWKRSNARSAIGQTLWLHGCSWHMVLRDTGLDCRARVYIKCVLHLVENNIQQQHLNPNSLTAKHLLHLILYLLQDALFRSHRQCCSTRCSISHASRLEQCEHGQPR